MESARSRYDAARNIGAALRSVRQFRGLSLDELAEATRIRPAYIRAIEAMELDQLPSRPFTIGYIRAMAQALDLDPDAAVARFKIDAPERAEPLRPPVGVSRERDPRLSLLAAGAAVVVCAVLVWNLAQHALAEDAHPAALSADALAAAGPAKPPPGAIVLGGSQPAPPDTEAPPPYVTPGLAKAVAIQNLDPNDLEAQAAAIAALEAEAKAPPPALSPAPPNPRAAVYGAAPQDSVVAFTARKPAALVIRGADGAVYFARQLKAGESYRAPVLPGLTVEAFDGQAFDLYVRGAFRGQLEARQVAIGQLEKVVG